MMLVNAREFVGASLLRNAVEDIERGLYRPADKQRRGDVIFRPLQHLFDLRPVSDIIKLHQAQRRAGNNQTVKVLFLNIFKVTVEVVQMLCGRVARFTGIDAQQLNIDLQR